MDSLEQEPLCQHNRIPRNCYLCYLHRNDDTQENYKTTMDTLYETISELKIRISKLEQYSMLQADHNKLQEEINKSFANANICNNEHRLKQIDENRAVSKHFDSLDKSFEDYREYRTSIEDLETDVMYLKENSKAIAIQMEGMKLMYGDPDFPPISGTRPYVSTPKVTGDPLLERLEKSEEAITKLDGWLDQMDKRIEKLENLSDFKKLEACVLDGAQTHATILKVQSKVKELQDDAKYFVKEKIILEKRCEDLKTDIMFLEDRFKEIETQQRVDMARITHLNEWLIQHDEHKSTLEKHDEKINILLLKLNQLKEDFKASQVFVPFDEDDYSDESCVVPGKLEGTMSPLIFSGSNKFTVIDEKIKEIEELQRVDKSRIDYLTEWLEKLDGKLKDYRSQLVDKGAKIVYADTSCPLAQTTRAYVREPKTTGLTFEEAITAFKAGKKIRFHDGMSESSIYQPNIKWGYGFDYDKICRDHWEIVE